MRTTIAGLVAGLMISACGAAVGERREVTGPDGSPRSASTSKPSVSAASSAASSTCPVTVPPQPGFVPPKPYPPEPPLSPEPYRNVWYGTPELWTKLPHTGAVWRDIPVADDGHVGNKTLWFSENFSTAETADFSGDGRITVTAVNLDGSTTTVLEKGPGVPSFNPHIKNFILVGLILPEPGCWEVTARYKGAELTYVLEVEERTAP